jgi:GTP-binding protein
VSDTFCDPSVTEPIAATPIDPPTLAMAFRINDGPLAGREGDKVQSRVIRERLLREAEGNIALRVTASETETDAFEVAGRGELQLGILIETMRREGFELTVGRPRVVFKTDEAGNKLEPIEEVIIDVDEEHSGVVVQKVSERKGELRDMRPSGTGRQRLVFHAPTRGLIGYQSELLSDTRGTAILNRLFHSYAPYMGDISARHTGALISNGEGEAVTYALFNLQDRGPMFIEPGMKVYPGMIVGEHTRGNDLEINVLKEKKLSNVRSKGSEEAQILVPPIKMSLEKALAYIGEDEFVEVTPKSIRLRKAVLDPHERKRLSRAKEAAA